MGDLIRSMALSAKGMAAQSARLGHTAENIANADTPGYRRKTVAFRPDGAGGVVPGPVRLDPRPLQRVHDPGHPLADESGSYNGSNVDLVIEVADARAAQRSYDANLRLFDQARQMTRGLLDLLRR